MMQAFTLPDIIPPHQVQAALRVIHLDIVRRGLDPAEYAEWRKIACPFPHLRLTGPIVGIAGTVLDALDLDPIAAGVRCEPQIVFHLPDVAEHWDTPPHVDEPPPWADGRAYTRIVGVALTDWTEANGCLRLWLGGDWRPVELLAGDVVVLNPSTPHATGLNRTGLPRIGVYLRWLEAATVPAGE
jgi:hypothetical protein